MAKSLLAPVPNFQEALSSRKPSPSGSFRQTSVCPLSTNFLDMKQFSRNLVSLAALGAVFCIACLCSSLDSKRKRYELQSIQPSLGRMREWAAWATQRPRAVLPQDAQTEVATVSSFGRACTLPCDYTLTQLNATNSGFLVLFNASIPRLKAHQDLKTTLMSSRSHSLLLPVAMHSFSKSCEPLKTKQMYTSRLWNPSLDVQHAHSLEQCLLPAWLCHPSTICSI